MSDTNGNNNQTSTVRAILVWIGAAFLITGALGIAQAPMSLWITPITEELGIPRSLYTTGDTVMKLTGAVCGFLFGSIYRRIGPKGCAVIACGGYLVQYYLLSHAQSMAYVWTGSFIGAWAYSFSGAIAIFAILPSWFPNKFGLATGAASAVSSVMASRMSLIANGWIQEGGWRYAQSRVMIFFVVVYAVAFILLKAHPDDPACGSNTKRKIANGEIVDPAKAKVGGIEYYKKVFRNKALMYGIALYFITGIFAVPISNMIVPNANARGFAAGIGAGALSMHYLVLIFSKIGSGWLRDRTGMKFVSPIHIGCAIITLIMYMVIPEESYRWVGLAWGIGANITQLWVPYNLYDAYGKENVDSTYLGFGQGVFQLGWAIGAPLVHVSYDRTGSYAGSCYIWIVAMVVIYAFSFYIIHVVGKRYREELAAKKESEAVQI